MHRVSKAGMFLTFCLAALTLVMSVGCDDDGGGSGSGGSSALTGTVAAGAPVVGTVTVRDANGIEVEGSIESDGSYTLDVSGLTPPFILWAEGTTNGRRVHLYSFVEEPGACNVTPATNMAMAMALDNDPVEFFANENAQVPDDIVTQVATAQAVIEEKIAVVLRNLGIQEFDIRKTAFTADGQGFDGLMDVVDFRCEGGTAVMEDKSTGKPFYQEDVTTGTVAVNKTGTELEALATEITSAMNTKESLAGIFKLIINAYADGVPTAAELNSMLGAYMADDFLEDGLRKTEIFTSWTTKDQDGEIEGPPPGIQFVALTYLRPMGTFTAGQNTIKEFDQENSGHTAGYWVYITVKEPDTGTIEGYLTSFVKTSGGDWKWYGNRCPIDEGGEAESRASMFVVDNGTPEFSSGIDLWREDENSPIPMEVLYVVADGLPTSLDATMSQHSDLFDFQVTEKTGWDALTTGMPTSVSLQLPDVTIAPDTYTTGLVMVKQSKLTDDNPWEANKLHIYNDTSHWGSYYTEADGLVNADLSDGQEFRYVGLSASGVPVCTWVERLEATPVAAGELNATYFPTLVTVNGKAPASLTTADFPFANGTQALTMTWTNPDDPYDNPIKDEMITYMAGVGYYGTPDGNWVMEHNPEEDVEGGNPWSFTSADFNLNASQGFTLYHLRLEIQAEDSRYRQFGLFYELNTAPQTPPTP